ncbi:MAG: hypothetical protein Q8J89_06705 [Caulobacter sp.]|nr:hypothetical protein [Caulobacter sp.]
MIKFEPARTRTGRDVRRAAVRHGWSHVLRGISLAASLTDGDMVHGIILISIIHANTASLRLSNGDQAYDVGANLPDDSLRTPVSVYAIAKQLGLPYETVRRHVARLIDEGRCIRVGGRGGIIVPASAISDMRPDAFIGQSLESLRGLVSELDRIGAVQNQLFHDSEKSLMIG